MISSGNGPSGNNSFEWQNNANGSYVAGSLTSSVSPNAGTTSITVAGSASAQYGFNGDPGYENQNITQNYTVNVDSNGNLSIDSHGSEEKSPNNLGIAISGSKTIN